MMLRVSLLAALLGAALYPVSANAAGTDAPAPDAARMWSDFLATGTGEKASQAFEIMDTVSYDGDSVDAAACAAHAADIDKAVAAVPVSLALRRTAYMCAIARKDEATADREEAMLSVLSRYALKQAGDPWLSRPAAIVWPTDAYALTDMLGMEVRYSYYPMRYPQRYFPMVLAAWDKDRKLERHLRFDYVDTQFHLRDAGQADGYPLVRTRLAHDYIEGGANGNIIAALDAQALGLARDEDRLEDRIAKVRAAAMQGAVLSAERWLTFCSEQKATDCPGLVDTLLDQAEDGSAYPMMVLAMAYLQGIGTPADPASAWQLLDRSQKSWQHATVEFVWLWDAMYEDKPWPAELESRVKALAAQNDPHAQRLLVYRAFADNKPVLSQAQLDLLAQDSQNRLGWGQARLAEYWEKNGDLDKAWAARVRAAQAGDIDSQAEYASALMYGRVSQVPADMAHGVRMAEQAAHGGDSWSARQLARRSMLAGDFRAAELWLTGPLLERDIDAAFDLAGLYEDKHPGLDEGPEESVRLYHLLEDTNRGAEARRRLAFLANAGSGMPKDPAKAEAWLLGDAEAGDTESQMLLGSFYLHGNMGKVDARKGRKWLEKAMAGGNENAFSEWAMWLYYDAGEGAKSAIEARDVLARAYEAGNDEVTNNYAWILCTTTEPAIFDGKRGLEVARKLGPVDALPPGTLDTVAACYAAAGDFTQAVALQERAAKGLAAIEGPQASDASTPDAAAKAKAKLKTGDGAAEAAAAAADAAAAAAVRSTKVPGYEQRLALYRAGQRYEEHGREE